MTGGDPLALVEAWRARGAAKFDPVAFGVVEALARRAAAQQGLARQLLVQRVEQRLAALDVCRVAATPAVPAPRRMATRGL